MDVCLGDGEPSFRAEIHHGVCCAGSFAGAMRGIETLRRHCIRVAVRVSVHRVHVHVLEGTARFLVEEPTRSANCQGDVV